MLVREERASCVNRTYPHCSSFDESRFGLEYDLDIYNVVAVNDFNMGAMENKGLNVFNTAYVLADQKTASDGDYERVEAVIGHEVSRVSLF